MQLRKRLFYTLRTLSLVVVTSLGYFAWKRERWLPKAASGPLQQSFAAKERLTFFALGDTGTGGKEQYATAQAMEERCARLGGIDGILLLGDNFYPVGVATSDDAQWQAKIEIPYGSPCLGRAPIFPILGNHDYRGKVAAQIAYSQQNPRWKMPFRFYTVDFGKLLRIVAFDSAFPDYCLDANACAVDYLLRELDTAGPRWRVVMGHNPLASASTLGHSHSGGIFGTLMRPLLCQRVDLYLSGHAHHLEERRFPGCGLSAFVAGAGGADLYPVRTQSDSLFAMSRFGYLELLVTQTAITTSFLGQDGQVLHTSEHTTKVGQSP